MSTLDTSMIWRAALCSSRRYGEKRLGHVVRVMDGGYGLRARGNALEWVSELSDPIGLLYVVTTFWLEVE